MYLTPTCGGGDQISINGGGNICGGGGSGGSGGGVALLLVRLKDVVVSSGVELRDGDQHFAPSTESGNAEVTKIFFRQRQERSQINLKKRRR